MTISQSLANITGSIPHRLAIGIACFIALSPTILVLCDEPKIERETRTIEGWTVHVNKQLLQKDGPATDKALELLTVQLKEIKRVVPKAAVVELQKVPLWFSPEYPKVNPRAEYHPGADWLRDNGRDPVMAQGVEFTDVRDFEPESRRMPCFVLHELAHAYHDRVLPEGFANKEIAAAYEKAKAGGKYDKVERQDSEGNKRMDRAYALTNPMEYFAESTEAYFGHNDFFPYVRAELEKHDPEMCTLLGKLWQVPEKAKASQVIPPPAELNAPAFYKKFISANGYPIVASEKVSDYALQEAAFLANLMLAKRPDVREAMIKSGSRMCIIAYNEFTTDLPEWEKMEPKNFWDARARGMGGSQTDPYCSSAEENLLAFPGDPYSTECIFIHEFAHNIHLRGMVNVDSTFDTRVQAAYDAAMATGLWKGKYASTNHHEYFAEGVQSWFDNNRENDHDHNHVNTRVELIEYDPKLADLCREVFGDTELKYTKPATRLHDHLAGYDPEQSPRFVWPERLLKEKEEIRAKAIKRSEM